MLKILIFDSGVGGLSISQSLSESMPSAEQILLSDNAYFPYGEMHEGKLVDRVSRLLIKAVELFSPDCIVVACNTVSTVALNKIRTDHNIPIIGVVPAIKPAAELSQSKVIGLLATPATVEREYTADLIRRYAGDCEVFSIGSTTLVSLAENKLRGIAIDQQQVKIILQPFIDAVKEKQLDVVILGCTHFPLLSKILSEVLPETVTLIDSSKAIARQVANVLSKQANKATNHEIRHLCYMTDLENKTNLNSGLDEYGFNSPLLFTG